MGKIEKITLEEKKELEKLKNTNFTTEEIANFLGRSKHLVKQEFNRGGGRFNYSIEKSQEETLKREKNRKLSYTFRTKKITPLTFEERKEIENLKNLSISEKQIGDKIGRHKNVINREFKLFNSRQEYNALEAQKISDEKKEEKFFKLRKKIINFGNTENELLIDKDVKKDFLSKKNSPSLESIQNVQLPSYIPRLPLKIWIDRFKEECAPKRLNWKKEIRFAEFWLKHLGEKIAVEISPLEIEEVSNIIINTKSRLKSQTNISHNTRIKYLMFLSSIFTTAIKEWKWAAFNPISAVKTKEKQNYNTKSKEKVFLHDKIREDLINIIKEKRKDKFNFDRKLAEHIGISLSVFQSIMNPESNITLKVICKVCEKLGINLYLGI